MPKPSLPALELCFIPAGYCCLLGSKKVSRRGIFPTEKDQRQDTAWDLLFHGPAMSGFEAEITILFGKTPLCVLSALCAALTLKSIGIF